MSQPQNRKYTTYYIVVRGGSRQGHVQQVQKILYLFFVWLLRYASRQTDIQTNRHRDTLIAILCTPCGDEVITDRRFGRDACTTARQYTAETCRRPSHWPDTGIAWSKCYSSHRQHGDIPAHQFTKQGNRRYQTLPPALPPGELDQT